MGNYKSKLKGTLHMEYERRFANRIWKGKYNSEFTGTLKVNTTKEIETLNYNTQSFSSLEWKINFEMKRKAITRH